MREMRGIVYDYAQFNVSSGETDYNVDLNQSALFSNVPTAKGLAIFFNRSISLKIGSSLMPEIALTIGDSPFQSPLNFLEFSNLFISNSSGNICAVKILIW